MLQQDGSKKSFSSTRSLVSSTWSGRLAGKKKIAAISIIWVERHLVIWVQLIKMLIHTRFD